MMKMHSRVLKIKGGPAEPCGRPGRRSGMVAVSRIPSLPADAAGDRIAALTARRTGSAR